MFSCSMVASQARSARVSGYACGEPPNRLNEVTSRAKSDERTEWAQARSRETPPEPFIPDDAGEREQAIIDTLPPQCTTRQNICSRRRRPAGTDGARRRDPSLLSTGAVKCWGRNVYGELGNGSQTGSATPVAVSGIANATAISAGGSHTCALLSTGAVKCWGYNADGELGNGSTTGPDCGGYCSATPVAVNGITTATAITTNAHLPDTSIEGYGHTCALLSTGAVECWGLNGDGELGNGSTTGPDCGGYCSATPVAVGSITNATAISAGGSHTCALLSTGAVECWGYNANGELGNGNTTGPNPAPMAVGSITNATAISAGGSHTCALLSTGAVECWGYNADGNLGNGDTTNSDLPILVSGFS
jgi:alpha-tubulin suppressor-like RCC1 family protein